MKYLLCCISLLAFVHLHAQDNYEIQVYGSQTQQPGTTMFELHSNYTFNGSRTIQDGVLPSHHALHETLEITTGLGKYFETGIYLFTAYIPGHGYQLVGSHLRPRIMVPQEWGLPVGLSLSVEGGYQKADFSSSTWNIEIRPIADKQWNKWYLSFNPTLGISLSSQYDKSIPSFEPNLKLNYALFRNGAIGLEYYGNMGYISQFEKWPLQNHAIFATFDLLNNTRWELNLGAGAGITRATDGFVGKLILGRRINWNAKRPPAAMAASSSRIIFPRPSFPVRYR